MKLCFAAHVLLLFLVVSMPVVGDAIVLVRLMLDTVLFGILGIFLMCQE